MNTESISADVDLRLSIVDEIVSRSTQSFYLYGHPGMQYNYTIHISLFIHVLLYFHWFPITRSRRLWLEAWIVACIIRCLARGSVAEVPTHLQLLICAHCAQANTKRCGKLFVCKICRCHLLASDAQTWALHNPWNVLSWDSTGVCGGVLGAWTYEGTLRLNKVAFTPFQETWLCLLGKRNIN